MNDSKFLWELYLGLIVISNIYNSLTGLVASDRKENTKKQQQLSLKEKSCAICHSFLNKPYFVTKCGHCFHRTCLQNCVSGDFTIKNKCPTCCKNISRRQVNLIIQPEPISISLELLNTIEQSKSQTHFPLENKNLFFNETLQILKQKIPLNNNQLNNAMRHLIVNGYCWYAEDIFEILSDMGASISEKELGNYLNLLFKKGAYFFQLLKCLYKAGGRLNQQQLNENFFLCLSRSSINEDIYIKYLFKWGLKLEQHQLNDSLQIAINKNTILDYAIASEIFNNGGVLSEDISNTMLINFLQSQCLMKLTIGVHHLLVFGATANVKQLNDIALSVITKKNFTHLDVKCLESIFSMGAKPGLIKLNQYMLQILDVPEPKTSDILKILYKNGGRLTSRQLHDAMLIAFEYWDDNLDDRSAAKTVKGVLRELFVMGARLTESEFDYYRHLVTVTPPILDVCNI